MNSCRLLILGPSDEPTWVKVYIRPMGETWAAIIVTGDELPPEPGQLKGLAFFGETPEEVEQKAREYPGAPVEWE